MMMFNVEDLLALPQLKQGKLPKFLAEIDVREAASEVAGIMGYLLKAKDIHFETKYFGFSSNFSILFDKQRFQ